MLRRILQNLDKSLFLTIVLALVLRFAYLSYAPPSLNWDEVSHGYNAYSILTTGRDEWGVGFPTIFRAYGDYKLPVYIYATAVSEKLFGLSSFAVRFPSALAGVGTVIFTYFLTLELFKKKSLANLSSFLVAVEPWSLFLSRGGFEANLALFFIVSGVYFFLKSFRIPGSLVLGITLMGLSVWTYNSARIFVPVLLLALLAVYFRDLKKSFLENRTTMVTGFLVLVFFFIPMFVQLVQPVGLARYGKVSIINKGAVASINEARGVSKLPPFFNRLVNNKATYFAGVFAKNWASHYSLPFLFGSGGTNYQFSIPGRGLLYWIDAVPLALGLLWLVFRRSKANSLIVAWFLLSPIASALTSEAPQVLRSIVVLPVPMIITAIGVCLIAEFLKNKSKVPVNATIAVFVILIYLFFESYATEYITEYRTKYSWSWQYGYEQVVDYARKHYADYDKIIVSKKYGEPHEFFLFFQGWDSERYNNDSNLIRYAQTDWFWIDRFDKFYFVNDWQIPKEKPLFVLESKKEEIDCSLKSVRCLLITSPDNYPKGWEKLSTVNFLNGSPAFEIYASN